MTAPLSPARIAEIEALLLSEGPMSDLLFSSRDEAIRDLLAERELRDWRPIETAKDYEEVLVWLPAFGAATATRGKYGWMIGKRSIIGRSAAALDIEPTHWMQLPEPPSDD